MADAGAEKMASRRLLQVIKSRAGVNLTECYQCEKCSNGCAIAEITDLLPHALIKRIHFGQEKAILSSRHFLNRGPKVSSTWVVTPRSASIDFIAASSALAASMQA